MKSKKDVEEFCRKNKIKCEFYQGTDFSTSKKVHEKLGISDNKVAKTIIFMSDKGDPLAVIIKSCCKIVQNKLAKILGFKHIRLANYDEVVKYTGYLPGGICPIDLNILVILDKDILNEDYIFVGGGDKDTLLKIKVEDLIKVLNPKIIDVPKKRIFSE